MEELFCLKYEIQNGNFIVFLTKRDFIIEFATASQKVFEDIWAILKKKCILGNFSDDYECEELLGSGHFSTVYAAKRKSKNLIKFAAKFISKKTSKFKKEKVCFFLYKARFLRK